MARTKLVPESVPAPLWGVSAHQLLRKPARDVIGSWRFLALLASLDSDQ